MITVDILGESRYKFDRKKIRKIVEDTLTKHGISGEVELSIAIVGERKMTELHLKYMNEPGPTDVLSFPLEGVNFPDEILRLGDVVVCYPVAVKQAGENNRMVDEEIDFLVEHGCLHLLGIHHD